MCKILECCYIPYFPVLMLRSPVLKKYVLQHEKKDTILLAYYYLTVTAQWRYLNQVSFHVSSCQPLSSRYVWWKKGLMVYKHDIFLLNFFVSTQPTYMKQDIKKMSGWDILHFLRKHSLRPIFISSQLSAQWVEPPWDAEPRFELGPALQQASALPTEQHCTLSHTASLIINLVKALNHYFFQKSTKLMNA